MVLVQEEPKSKQRPSEKSNENFVIFEQRLVPSFFLYLKIKYYKYDKYMENAKGNAFC